MTGERPEWVEGPDDVDWIKAVGRESRGGLDPVVQAVADAIREVREEQEAEWPDFDASSAGEVLELIVDAIGRRLEKRARIDRSAFERATGRACG